MHEINKPPIIDRALQQQPRVCPDSGVSIKCSTLSGASSCALSTGTFSDSEQVSDAWLHNDFVINSTLLNNSKFKIRSIDLFIGDNLQ